ncbi:hypothetical protein ACWGIV_11270 [Streptomyces sp. NPDC054844]
MTDVNLGSARIVTMRELTNKTSEIMRELNDAGEAALVTKHGRFIALIQPLAGVKVEALAINRMLSSLAAADEIDDEMHESVEGGEATQHLGLQIKLTGDDEA